ncbi:hypothetical protein GCM10009595_02230 [Falsarthrobacter nasiphocae]
MPAYLLEALLMVIAVVPVFLSVPRTYVFPPFSAGANVADTDSMGAWWCGLDSLTEALGDAAGEAADAEALGAADALAEAEGCAVPPPLEQAARLRARAPAAARVRMGFVDFVERFFMADQSFLRMRIPRMPPAMPHATAVIPTMRSGQLTPGCSW